MRHYSPILWRWVYSIGGNLRGILPPWRYFAIDAIVYPILLVKINMLKFDCRWLIYMAFRWSQKFENRRFNVLLPVCERGQGDYDYLKTQWWSLVCLLLMYGCTRAITTKLSCIIRGLSIYRRQGLTAINMALWVRDQLIGDDMDHKVLIGADWYVFMPLRFRTNYIQRWNLI